MSISVTNGSTTIIAEGETALRLLYLREAFADSATWRALVALPRDDWNAVKTKAALDDASRPDALAAVVLDRWPGTQLNEDKGGETPRILLRPFDESDVSWTSPENWDVRDLFMMLIHVPLPDDLRANDADIPVASVDFWNKVDAIIKEFLTVGASMSAERVGNPQVSRIVLPGEINPDQNNARRVRQSAYVISCQGSSR